MVQVRVPKKKVACPSRDLVLDFTNNLEGLQLDKESSWHDSLAMMK
jgi:hypothetical protein